MPFSASLWDPTHVSRPRLRGLCALSAILGTPFLSVGGGAGTDRSRREWRAALVNCSAHGWFCAGARNPGLPAVFRQGGCIRTPCQAHWLQEAYSAAWGRRSVRPHLSPLCRLPLLLSCNPPRRRRAPEAQSDGFRSVMRGFRQGPGNNTGL